MTTKRDAAAPPWTGPPFTEADVNWIRRLLDSERVGDIDGRSAVTWVAAFLASDAPSDAD